LGAEEEVAFCFVGLEICVVFASVPSNIAMGVKFVHTLCV
jgi:hypothetical protein